MPLTISLLTIRPGGSMTSGVLSLVESYLGRCGQPFRAGHRTYRSEAALLAAVAAERKGGAAALWIADPGGRDLTSEDFAGQLRAARDGGMRNLLLAVGPADGWSPAARSAAALRLSLGNMTLPHELAALLLAEQVYRAGTILLGHPYHCGH